MTPQPVELAGTEGEVLSAAEKFRNFAVEIEGIPNLKDAQRATFVKRAKLLGDLTERLVSKVSRTRHYANRPKRGDKAVAAPASIDASQTEAPLADASN